MEIIEIQISVLLEHSHSHSYLLSEDASMIQRLDCVI